MKLCLKAELEMEIEDGRLTILAPPYINLYDFGFVKAGKAAEGYNKWGLSMVHRDCGFFGKLRFSEEVLG